MRETNEEGSSRARVMNFQPAFHSFIWPDSARAPSTRNGGQKKKFLLLFIFKFISAPEIAENKKKTRKEREGKRKRGREREREEEEGSEA